MPPLDRLPPTIRDSIILCRLLNRRYLWIDSLCITQNDANTLRGQLEQMDLIYQCAEFTIVAAAGLGANAGLPGIATTTPRAPQQLVETVHGLRLTVPLPSLAEAAKHSFWKTRAWTYQEQMLSSKCLVFTSRQVYYECASEIYTEDIYQTRETTTKKWPFARMLTPKTDSSAWPRQTYPQGHPPPSKTRPLTRS